MVLAGAKGLAKQLLPIIRDRGLDAGLMIYDRNPELKNLYEFHLTHNLDEVARHFESTDPRFILGMGKPQIRKLVSKQLTGLGGMPYSLISATAMIAEDALFGTGSSILSGVIMENGSRTGIMCLLNLRCLICHDVQLGDYCEVGPGAILLGESSAGDGSFIGAGAIINPGVRLGKNVLVGSGSVVTRDFPDGSKIAGVPARLF